MILYWIAKQLVRLYLFLTHPMKVYHRENMKYTGPMVLVCNHLGNHDPLVVHMLCTGRPKFMAKKELFKNKLVAAAIKCFGAFPVDRGAGDRAAVNAALEVLKEGGTLAMFPEGTRNKANEDIQPFMNGAAMIALRAGVPVLPICILRRPKLFRLTHVLVGEPVDVAELSRDCEKTSDKIRMTTAYLHDKLAYMKKETKL